MYAKLKSGRVVSGKVAELFNRIGIASECDEPIKKMKAGRPKSENPKAVKPVKKAVKKKK